MTVRRSTTRGGSARSGRVARSGGAARSRRAARPSTAAQTGGERASGPFRRDLFFPELEAESKEQLFAKLVDALAAARVAQHRKALLQALIERERLGTTGLGHGVAVPHARSMVVTRTAVAFARLTAGLDFEALDGAPVRLVFLIVAPYGTPGATYLPILGGIARAVHDEATRTRLHELQSFEELESIVRPAVVTGPVEAAT